MQLSVDQKIQAAIQPLIQRITALEAENEKFRQEIAALHVATQPKIAHKPAPKPPVQVERPQTVKGGRKKSVQNHEVKPETKTDKKPVIKKQEPKVDGEEAKAENPKHPGTKTPVIGNKGVGSPNLTKDQNAVNKDVKPKPTTGTGNRVSTTNINNKSIIAEKKATNKSIQANEQKKEGQQHHEEKKEHTSHEKPEIGKPAHNIKTPAVIKKPVQVKKPTNPVPAPVNTAKKTGKQPIKDPKQKAAEPKPESPKVELKQETKDEVKQEPKQEIKQEPKEETKQADHTDATKQEIKAEQEALLHQEQAEHVENVQPKQETVEKKQETAPQVHVEQSKQHEEQEAL